MMEDYNDENFQTQVTIDRANAVAMMYFRYMFDNRIDMHDEQDPFVKNMNEASMIRDTQVFQCSTLEEFGQLNTRIDELEQYFYDKTGIEMKN